MFDKIVSVNTPRSIDVTHIEKRAPTDESVRLLKEFEDAAEKKILEVIRFEDNDVRGLVVASQRRPTMMASIDYCYRFTLNGKKYDNRIAIDDRPPRNRNDHCVELVNLLSKQIALDILNAKKEK